MAVRPTPARRTHTLHPRVSRSLIVINARSARECLLWASLRIALSLPCSGLFRAARRLLAAMVARNACASKLLPPKSS